MEEDGRRILRSGGCLIGASDGLVGAGVEQKSAGAGGVDTLWPIVRIPTIAAGDSD
jgi:hypothetical protein